MGLSFYQHKYEGFMGVKRAFVSVPGDYDCASAISGFHALDVEVITRTPAVSELGPDSMVVGGLGTFAQLHQKGISIPEWNDYPLYYSHPLMYNRAIRKMPWGSEELQNNRADLFIKKPFSKSFQPGVYHFPLDYCASENGELLWSREHIEDTDEVWVSDVVNFAAEYRAFVIQGIVRDVRLYRGDWRRMPSADACVSFAHNIGSLQGSYAMDVGVTASDDGRTGITAIVECNNGYAVGSYGLAPWVYAEFLIHHWVGRKEWK